MRLLLVDEAGKQFILIRGIFLFHGSAPAPAASGTRSNRVQTFLICDIVCSLSSGNHRLQTFGAAQDPARSAITLETSAAEQSENWRYIGISPVGCERHGICWLPTTEKPIPKYALRERLPVQVRWSDVLIRDLPVRPLHSLTGSLNRMRLPKGSITSVCLGFRPLVRRGETACFRGGSGGPISRWRQHSTVRPRARDETSESRS